MDSRTAEETSNPKAAKKRNKRKNKKVEAEGDIDEDELLDRLINENRLAATGSNATAAVTASVLKVDSRHLDPNVEIESLIKKNMLMCGSKRIVCHKNNPRAIGRVIKMKAGWPLPKNTGLSLDVFKVENGVHYFRINHAENYRNQQYMFTVMRKNNDYESIMDILNENPYHLESLLISAQYFIMQEESNTAIDLIERALFAVEAASCKFNLLLLEHQLDYTWRDNRVVFNLLWNLIQILDSRSCYSTALQYAKILYGKNPDEDPLAVSLVLDMLSLKAKNYQFLVDFYDQYGVKRNLDMLPSFLYSTAYAHYCLFEKSTDEQHLIKSRELICKAFTRFPFVLSQVTNQLGIDAGPAVAKEALFRPLALERETDGIKLLVKIYLHHSLSFWKQPNCLAWLESTSAEFLSNITSDNRKEAQIWSKKRKALFVGMPLNVKRHALLCGLAVDDDGVHDMLDPYPPPNTAANYWPEKSLEEQLNMVSLGSESSPSGEENVFQSIISYTQQFFRRSLFQDGDDSQPGSSIATTTNANTEGDNQQDPSVGTTNADSDDVSQQGSAIAATNADNDDRAGAFGNANDQSLTPSSQRDLALVEENNFGTTGISGIETSSPLNQQMYEESEGRASVVEPDMMQEKNHERSGDL